MHQGCSVIALSKACKEKKPSKSFRFFNCDDAKSLNDCITFDDQYMNVVYNLKTTSYIEHSRDLDVTLNLTSSCLCIPS